MAVRAVMGVTGSEGSEGSSVECLVAEWHVVAVDLASSSRASWLVPTAYVDMCHNSHGSV